MLLRHSDAEPAGHSEGAMEIVWKFAVTIPGEPVIVAEPSADFFDRVADRLLLG
jgi:hypothetical protein